MSWSGRLLAWPSATRSEEGTGHGQSDLRRVYAIDEGGEITVRTSRASGRAVVEVLDNGGGIPADIRARIFGPFFTTKDVGSGTGLGLDMVRRIVERHLGDVTVESRPGRTRFEVRLPASDTTAGAEES